MTPQFSDEGLSGMLVRRSGAGQEQAGAGLPERWFSDPTTVLGPAQQSRGPR